MLAVIFNSGLTATWNHGHSTSNISPSMIAEVVEVVADGDELIYLESNFKNLPTCLYSKRTHYYGDHAKFIVGNL